MKPKKPYRQKMEDILVHGHTSERDIRCDFAVAPFDRAVHEADRKWGIDVLPSLVTPQMAEKYGGAVAYLNSALKENDPEKVANAAANCVKGIQAMEVMAINSGHAPKSTEVWEFEIDGMKFGIMQDGNKWPQAKADHPGLQLFTPREIAIALRDLQGSVYREVAAIKDAFPGAEIVEVRGKVQKAKAETIDLIDDQEIPF